MKFFFERMLFAALALSFGLNVFADVPPQARIEVHLQPDTAVDAGQPVRLLVDIWVTTWFLEAPQLPPLDVPGAAVVSTDAAQHMTDKSGAVTWFGIEREYVITPLREGPFAIPPLTVIVKPGPDGKPVALVAAALTGTALPMIRPAAAGDAPITTRLDATQDVERSAEDLKVGDSITRTIAQVAADVPAMLLQPIEFAPVDGLAVYAQPPVVENRTAARGDFVGGRRVDAVTYIVQRAGRYTLPEIDIAWWNPQTRQLQKAALPAIDFKAQHAAIRSEFTPTDAGLLDSSERFLVLAAIALLSFALYRWLKPDAAVFSKRVYDAVIEWRRRYEASEYRAYRLLLRSLRSGNDAEIYRALCDWIERLPHGNKCAGPMEFAKRCGDATLRSAIDGLTGNLFGVAAKEQVGLPRGAVAEARRRWLRGHVVVRSALVSLNP